MAGRGAIQWAIQRIICSARDLRQTVAADAARPLFNRASGASSPVKRGGFSQQSGRTLRRRRGRGAARGRRRSSAAADWRRRRARHRTVASGVALPNHVDVAHRQIDLLLVVNLLRQVHQHAVTHFDGVVQADQRRRGCPAIWLKYSNIRSRPRQLMAYSPHGLGGSVSTESAALDRHHAVDVARRKGDDAACAELAADQRRQVGVQRPKSAARCRCCRISFPPCRSRSAHRAGIRERRDRAGRLASFEFHKPPAIGGSRRRRSGRRPGFADRGRSLRQWRFAIRASEGPIFPPAPKTSRSPSMRESASRTASVGWLRISSNWSRSSMALGNAVGEKSCVVPWNGGTGKVGSGCRFSTQRMLFSFFQGGTLPG